MSKLPQSKKDPGRYCRSQICREFGHISAPCQGGPKGPRFHIFFLMVLMAPFSSRDTWAWEMPTSAETSIWVLPS